MKGAVNMSIEYIPVATAGTTYYKPQTEQEMEQMTATMKLGDMLFNKWVFQASGGLWYTMGLMDKNDPTTLCLFPNITLGEDADLPPLTRWGIARMTYLKEHQKFVAAQFGVIGEYPTKWAHGSISIEILYKCAVPKGNSSGLRPLLFRFG